MQQTVPRVAIEHINIPTIVQGEPCWPSTPHYSVDGDSGPNATVSVWRLGGYERRHRITGREGFFQSLILILAFTALAFPALGYRLVAFDVLVGRRRVFTISHT